ncbi:HxlR-like helix-turn-helix [uncultured archaeon]|nr:HxlR-like helix-turn-helix [uncultured archaeon]
MWIFRKNKRTSGYNPRTFLTFSTAIGNSQNIRYSEIRDTLGEINSKVLTDRLKELEEAGLIKNPDLKCNYLVTICYQFPEARMSLIFFTERNVRFHCTLFDTKSTGTKTANSC